MIWAVPLSTVDLITHRLTPGHKSLAFGVYLNSVTHDGPLVQTVLYLQDSRFRGSPLKRFPERTSYLPSSFGISPLPTPHPSLFQQTRVRASSAFYRTFTLDMGRSPGFRVHNYVLRTPISDSLSLRLRFFHLNLARNHDSPVHSARGTPSPINGLRQLVGTWFQELFHSLSGVLFTFPSRYWFTIGH